VLRPLEPSDAESLAAHGDDRRIWLNASNRFPHPYTAADAVAYIEAARAESPLRRFAIDVDGAAVGAISLVVGTDVAYRSAEIGYWVGAAYWGRGIASAVVPPVTAYAFETLDLLRVAAIVYAHNTASARVLEKAGFVLEGVLRSSAVKDGRVVDQMLFARVRGSER
jgi:RimJ/RimL family protein N-acetyltransferase